MDLSSRMLMMGASQSVSKTWRYWRIYVTAGNDAILSLSEIELRATIGGADLTSPSTPSVASSFYLAGSEADKAVDNNTASSWIAQINAVFPEWIRLDLGTSQTVLQVAMRPQDGAPLRAPKDFLIQGSSDGTNFTTVRSVANSTSWTNGAYRTFDL